MNAVQNLLLFILLVVTVIAIALIRSQFHFTGFYSKIKNSDLSPWGLHEFLLLLNPSKGKQGEYYRFNEENVRSHAHKYLGRFDTAIMHWEESPVLDLLIERKFPVNNIPKREREEDMFQAGLYTLALSESGVSCSETRLVTIYCLQATAKRCLEKNFPNKCWKCTVGKKYLRKYNEEDVMKHLKRLDEIWYFKRKPKASPSASKCRVCPYSRNGTCNYAMI
ncbi:hypothetical protein EU527_01010 [Candidatus Thorarchaeota archaeon]|nr:MAG: hypothetical protein EU527_01010 [Candidatus Thorarchaeota archaeon]